MANGEPVEIRIARLENQMIEQVTRTEERWGEAWRSKERQGGRIGDHEDRIRGLEDFKNTLLGKIAVASTLGAMVGGAIITMLVRTLGG